jgi:hypothetical protein
MREKKTSRAEETDLKADLDDVQRRHHGARDATGHRTGDGVDGGPAQRAMARLALTSSHPSHPCPLSPSSPSPTLMLHLLLFSLSNPNATPPPLLLLLCIPPFLLTRTWLSLPPLLTYATGQTEKQAGCRRDVM